MAPRNIVKKNTPEERELLRLLWNEDVTFRDIAKEMHRSRGWIKDTAQQMGLKDRSRGMGWSKEHTDLLVEMWFDMKEYVDIAPLVGRTPSAVKEKAYAMGLSRKSRAALLNLDPPPPPPPPKPLLFSYVTLVKSVQTKETFEWPILEKAS